MFRKSFQVALKRVFAVATGVLLSATVAWSGSYRVLHSFKQNSANPSSGLVLDANGNAYGTTAKGGFNNAGTVYQISPTTGFHIIYAFSGHPDGKHPQGNLVFDAAGNLYGTTVNGGTFTSCDSGAGCGTVFRLTPPKNGGTWTEAVLYNFTGGNDGANPQAGVILDQAGNLYGTTKMGGTAAAGTIFQVTLGENDQWTEVVLYSFDGTGGAFPLGGLIFDGVGNLYGTTSLFGGGGGTAFQLSPAVGNGNWIFTSLYTFGSQGSKDGVGPWAGLTSDDAGNLYGTTTLGGDSAGGGNLGYGTVFELTPNFGSWTEQVLYSFAGGSDGANPEAAVVLDESGNLYGTTFVGGGNGCLGGGCGSVFRLTLGPNGQWTESRFLFGNSSKGSQPATPLLRHNGSIYGTTSTGAVFSSGAVFRIVP